jgi:hypothetical protein
MLCSVILRRWYGFHNVTIAAVGMGYYCQALWNTSKAAGAEAHSAHGYARYLGFLIATSATSLFFGASRCSSEPRFRPNNWDICRMACDCAYFWSGNSHCSSAHIMAVFPGIGIIKKIDTKLALWIRECPSTTEKALERHHDLGHVKPVQWKVRCGGMQGFEMEEKALMEAIKSYSYRLAYLACWLILS